MSELTLTTGTKMEKFLVLMPKDQDQKFEQTIAQTLFVAVRTFLAAGVIKQDLQKYLVAKLKESRRYNKRGVKSLSDAVTALMVAVEEKKSPMHFEKILFPNGKQKDDLIVTLPMAPEGLQFVVVEFMMELTSRTTQESPTQPNPGAASVQVAPPSDAPLQVAALIGPGGEKGIVVGDGQSLRRVNEEAVPQESGRPPRIIRSHVGKAPEPTPAQAARVAGMNTDEVATDPGSPVSVAADVTAPIQVTPTPPPAEPAPLLRDQAKNVGSPAEKEAIERLAANNGRSPTPAIPQRAAGWQEQLPMNRLPDAPIVAKPAAAAVLEKRAPTPALKPVQAAATPQPVIAKPAVQITVDLEKRLQVFQAAPEKLQGMPQEVLDEFFLEVEDVLKLEARLKHSEDQRAKDLDSIIESLSAVDYVAKMGREAIADSLFEVILELRKMRNAEANLAIAAVLPGAPLQVQKQSRPPAKVNLTEIVRTALANPKTPLEVIDQHYHRAFTQNAMPLCMEMLTARMDLRETAAADFFDIMVQRMRLHQAEDDPHAEAKMAEACFSGMLKLPDWKVKQSYDLIAEMLEHRKSWYYLGLLKERGGVSDRYVDEYHRALQLGREVLAADEPAKALARHLSKISVILQKPVEHTMIVDRRGSRTRMRTGDRWEQFWRKLTSPRSWFA